MYCANCGVFVPVCCVLSSVLCVNCHINVDYLTSGAFISL